MDIYFGVNRRQEVGLLGLIRICTSEIVVEMNGRLFAVTFSD